MKEKIIFAKPTVDNFVFVVVFEENGQVYLHEVLFAGSAKELNAKIAENIEGIEYVKYDVSMFMQEGKDLREQLSDTPVYCYKPKQKLQERIISQSDWLYENLVIDCEYDDSDYRKFVELFRDYRPNDETCNTIAIDVICDVAKYIRRMSGL